MLRGGRTLHRVRILAVLAISSLLCTAASAKLVNYVIHISVDGLRPDAITNLGPANLPNFYRLRTEGAFTDNARTDYDYTETLPNHATQLTGRGVLGTTGHNWKENSDPEPGATLASNKGSYVAGAFDVVHDYGLRTGEYASKSKFSLFDISWNASNGAVDVTPPDHGRDKIDNYVNMGDTLPLAKKLASDMLTHPLNYAFLHIANPDTVGHGHGFDPTPGSAYSNIIIKMDERLGVIFDLVDSNPQFTGRTAIILTTDHGGTGTNHANASIVTNYTIPFYVWGPGVTPGASLYALNPTTRLDPGTGRPTYSASVQPIRNGEAGNLALRLLGLPAIPGSTIGQAQNLAFNTSTVPAPSAPTATAASNVINCGFTAKWNSVSTATGYILDVATDSAFNNLVSSYRDIVVGDVFSFNVTGLSAGTTHYYRVWAYNLNGTSGNASNTITVTTSGNVNPPSAPEAMAATNLTNTGFTANWAVGCGATGYRMDVSTTNTFSNFVAGYQNLDVGNLTSQTLNGLNANTTYYYRVRAYNGLGTSPQSNTASATTLDINWCVPSVPLMYGDMEYEDAYSVCPEWWSYSAGNGAPSWAKESTIRRSGLASQRAKNINASAGSLIGVYQTIDANVGDAFTFEGWVYPETNPAYAQAAMAVRWNGATAIPDGSASWKISGGPRLAWTKVQHFSGNATADRVTLFLDSRQKSGSVAITAYWDDVACYRAHVPPAPSISVATSTSLDMDVNAGCNSSNPAAEYAVTVGGGAYTLGTHFVQANGTVTTSPFWQSDAAWGITKITGLTTGTTYTFRTMARYSSTYTQATSLGVAASGMPSNQTPTPPTITQHPSDQTVAMGTAATFTVAATGTSPLAYQWQKNSVNLTNSGHYAGATTATLTISNADSNDEAYYRCVISNSSGSATSNQASLTISACTPPMLLNGDFEGGNTNGIATHWTGYQRAPNPTTAWTIQSSSPPTDGGLQYQQIANTSSTGGGGVRQNVTGCIIGTTYTVAGWMRTNSISAACTVKCSPSASTDWATAIDLSPQQTTTSTTWVPFSGTVVATGTSMTIWLDGQTGGTGLNKAACFDSVTVTGCSETTGPTITQQPSSQSICPGGTASFSVAAVGGTLTYQWQKNNANLVNGGHYAGATSPTLTIADADSNDAANYLCVVTNAAGSVASSTVALTLKAMMAADLDRDCDVDESDLNLFLACSSGPVTSLQPGCESSDFDGDNDVDQSDFGVLQRCFSGENVDADPSCAN